MAEAIEKGLVEAERFADSADVFAGRRVAGEDRRGIAGREIQQQEDDERDHRHDDDGREKPPDYVRKQCFLPEGVERRRVVRSNAVPDAIASSPFTFFLRSTTS